MKTKSASVNAVDGVGVPEDEALGVNLLQATEGSMEEAKDLLFSLSVAEEAALIQKKIWVI